MEKHIAQASYWLGLATALVALVWKALEALHVAPESMGYVKYMTFYKGGLLFLVISVASTALGWAKAQKV